MDRASVSRCIDQYLYRDTGDYKALCNVQASLKNSVEYVQRMDLMTKIDAHRGCVNSVEWNASGTQILSASDDNHLVVTELKSHKIVLYYKTIHRKNIFRARFVPYSNDQAVVSCSGEGLVLYTEFNAPFHQSTEGNYGELRSSYSFNCHGNNCVFDVLPLTVCPPTFLSCGSDGTVRRYDIRETTRCPNAVCELHKYIQAPCPVTSIDVAPLNGYCLALGGADTIIRLYDLRMLRENREHPIRNVTQSVKAFPLPNNDFNFQVRPTSLKFSPNETELLVNYSCENLYLFDLKHPGYDETLLWKSGKYKPRSQFSFEELPTARLRFSGDWSSTGPGTFYENDAALNRLGQARPTLNPGLLHLLNVEVSNLLHDEIRSHVLRPSRWHPRVSLTRNREPTRNVPSTDPTESDPTNPTDAAGVPQPPYPKNEEEKLVLNYGYVKRSFSGHHNSHTSIKTAGFWGDNFIMSGSDCGHIFIWCKKTGELIKTLLADRNVVNRVVPHPTLPYLLSCGIDYTYKVWAPIAPMPTFNAEMANNLKEANRRLLLQAKDTVTVPIQVMLRALSSMSYSRFNTNNNNRNRNENRPGSGTADGSGGGTTPN